MGPKRKELATYYAFATTDRGNPRVFEYADDESGIEALSNLIRSENVIGVVKGCKVLFEVSSVIDFRVGRETASNRMLLHRED